MDNITELAQLFAERNNPNDQIVFIGEYLDGGKIKIRDNVILQPGKYINAIPHCTCSHLQGSCNHAINIQAGNKCVVLRMRKQFIAVGRVRSG